MNAPIFNHQGYFEDFTVGDVLKHARGKTVSELDNVLITNMVLNTAEPHFNEHAAQKDPMFKHRIVYGGVNFSMVIGLAAQDTAQRAIRELSMDKIRLFAPVYHGDTLYAYSDVLAKEDHAEGGIVTFLHRGFNQNDVLIYSGERRVLLQKRPPAG
ncbi:MAG: MaoC family dehydratase [Caulobacterales bacterium]